MRDARWGVVCRPGTENNVRSCDTLAALVEIGHGHAVTLTGHELAALVFVHCEHFAAGKQAQKIRRQ